VSQNGPGFYDDPEVFATYMRRRERRDSPNDNLELPVVRELLGDPSGQAFLDLGCGDARFGKELLAAGAIAYTGVDGSSKMVDAARAQLAGTPGIAMQCSLESLTLPESSFDRACSRLALHYVEDVARVISLVGKSLKPGGLFVFSVEHPVITSSSAAATESGLRQDWIVDDYFIEGPRITNWMGSRVVKYHRTVADYFAAVVRAGLHVESLRESKPERKEFVDEALFRRRQRIPLFLFIAARRI
jgi:SAM-dependent methyltransferase